MTSPSTGTEASGGTPVSIWVTLAMPERSAAMLKTLAISSRRHAA
jgi:hypothetical protein